MSGSAQDSFGNLSRVRVHNTGLHQEKTDFSLAGDAAEFRVEDIPLRIGSNPLEITVLDEANNLSLKLGVIDRYDSTPSGAKYNDIDYSLLLLWAF